MFIRGGKVRAVLDEKLYEIKLKIKWFLNRYLYQFLEISGILHRTCFFIPPLLAMLFLGFAMVKVFVFEDATKGPYRKGMTVALGKDNFELARAYGERLMLWSGEPNAADRMVWASSLLGCNEHSLAFEHLNELAPNDLPGYPPAHRLKAEILTERFEKTGRSSLLQPLFFHLNQADEQDSYAMNLGFSIYYIATDQPDEAIPYLRSAVTVNPMLYGNFMSTYARAENQLAFGETLKDALTEVEKLTEKKPENVVARIEQARLLLLAGRQEKALAVLKEGAKTNPSPQLDRAIANYYMVLCDRTEDFKSRIDWIKKSLNADPSYSPPYVRLIQQYEQFGLQDSQRGSEIIAIAESQANRGDAVAWAHFALANFAYMRGDRRQYQLNLERTLEKDPLFPDAANNLAWELAHDKVMMDLDRALALAEDLVKRHPENPEYRDTYGTILFKRGDFESALDQLEQVMNEVADKVAVHSTLAKIYDHLEKPDLADLHREKSVEYAMRKKVN